MAETASYPLHFSFPVSSLWWKLWTLDGNMIAWGRKKLYFLIFPAARYGMRLKWMICKQKVCVFFFFLAFVFTVSQIPSLLISLYVFFASFLLQASLFSTGFSLLPVPRELDWFPCTMQWKAWAEVDETWVYDIMKLRITPGKHIFRHFFKHERERNLFFCKSILFCYMQPS